MVYAITRPLLLALVPLSLLFYLYSTRKIVLKFFTWCSCLKPPHSERMRESIKRGGGEGEREKKWLLRHSEETATRGQYSSSSPAATGINHQPSEEEEDDDPLYSTTDSHCPIET